MRVAVLAVLLLGCDAAEFRPSKGAHDYPAEPVAYRVHDVAPNCQLIGHIIRTGSLEAVESTVARHGGTHYRIVSDTGEATYETEWVGTNAAGSASTRKVQDHVFTAEAFRCR